MSSHVVVLDTSARRATIKTSPATYLSEVLQQACTKLSLDASHYGLRYDRFTLPNNTIDLAFCAKLWHGFLSHLFLLTVLPA